MVRAQCWLPDLELKVAGERGAGAVAVGSEAAFFTPGKGHPPTQGLAILTPRLLSLDPKVLKPQKETGTGCRGRGGAGTVVSKSLRAHKQTQAHFMSFKIFFSQTVWSLMGASPPALPSLATVPNGARF